MASFSGQNEEKIKEQLDDDVSVSLLQAIQKRTEVPQKLKRVEDKVLKCEKSQAEHITILPSTDPKKVACRYPLREPLPKEFETSSKTPNPEKTLSRVEQISKLQIEVQKALDELKNNIE